MTEPWMQQCTPLERARLIYGCDGRRPVCWPAMIGEQLSVDEVERRLRAALHSEAAPAPALAVETVDGAANIAVQAGAGSNAKPALAANIIGDPAESYAEYS